MPALTQAAHEALGGEPGTRPLVVDPFAGGGSIPLEALRVGADAFASDLNPVAVLLNKVVLEYIPKYGQRLADEVRKWGEWIKEQAEGELGRFYPKRLLAPLELHGKPLLLIDAGNESFGCVTTLDIQELLDSSGKCYTHYVEISESRVHGPTAMQVALKAATLRTEETLARLALNHYDWSMRRPSPTFGPGQFNVKALVAGRKCRSYGRYGLRRRLTDRLVLQLVPRRQKCRFPGSSSMVVIGWIRPIQQLESTTRFSTAP